MLLLLLLTRYRLTLLLSDLAQRQADCDFLLFDFIFLLFALTELDFGLKVVSFDVDVFALFFEFDLAVLVVDFDFDLLFTVSPTLGVITFALTLTGPESDTVNEIRPFILGALVVVGRRFFVDTFLTTPLDDLADNLGLAVVVVGLTVVGLDLTLDLGLGLMTELGGNADATNRLGCAADDCL